MVEGGVGQNFWFANNLPHNTINKINNNFGLFAGVAVNLAGYKAQLYSPTTTRQTMRCKNVNIMHIW